MIYGAKYQCPTTGEFLYCEGEGNHIDTKITPDILVTPFGAEGNITAFTYLEVNNCKCGQKHKIEILKKVRDV